MRSALIAALLLALVPSVSAGAPADGASVRARAVAAGRSAADADSLGARVVDAAAKGLASEVVAQKALEGIAKGVPTARLGAVLDDLAARLATGKTAVEAAGAKADAATQRAAADAIREGLDADAIGATVSAAVAADRSASAALVALDGLIAEEVPVTKAREAVASALARHFTNDQLEGLDRATAVIAAQALLKPAEAVDAALDGLSRGLSAIQIADERRGFQDGLSGRGGVGGTPAGGNPAQNGSAGAPPGQVPGGDDFEPPDSAAGHGHGRGGARATDAAHPR